MKILFRIAFVLLALAVIAGVLVALGLDSIAKTAVEKGGTFATGVDTKLESADLSIFGGSLKLSGLTIDNPEGYQDDHFFSLRHAGLQVNPDSVEGDTVEIPEIVVEGLHLTLERTKDGTNYGEILDNLKRFESADSGSAPEEEAQPEPAPEGQEKKFVVRDIRISDVQANVIFDALGEQKNVTVKVPDFTLENVGNSEDSQSIADILSRVIQEALNEVVKSGAGLLPDDMLNDVKGKLGEVKSIANQAKEELEAGLQNLLQGDGDTAGLKDAADKAKEGLKGLLGKDE